MKQPITNKNTILNWRNLNWYGRKVEKCSSIASRSKYGRGKPALFDGNECEKCLLYTSKGSCIKRCFHCKKTWTLNPINASDRTSKMVEVDWTVRH